MVEHLTHDLKIEGLNPTTAIGRKKNDKKWGLFYCLTYAILKLKCLRFLTKKKNSIGKKFRQLF